MKRAYIYLHPTSSSFKHPLVSSSQKSTDLRTKNVLQKLDPHLTKAETRQPRTSTHEIHTKENGPAAASQEKQTLRMTEVHQCHHVSQVWLFFEP